MSELPESVRVLEECRELQLKKSRDYQNPNSMIKQADYYPNGIVTILDIMWAKVLRMRSVMEAMRSAEGYEPNFESLEDSAKDLINYSSFFVAFCRGKINGQDPDRDAFNVSQIGQLIAQVKKAIKSLPRDVHGEYCKKAMDDSKSRAEDIHAAMLKGQAPDLEEKDGDPILSGVETLPEVLYRQDDGMQFTLISESEKLYILGDEEVRAEYLAGNISKQFYTHEYLMDQMIDGKPAFGPTRP